MTWDYFGFTCITRNTRNESQTVAINNAADISVIYFLVVLALGIGAPTSFHTKAYATTRIGSQGGRRT
ncbi:hypothetical protein AMECASPLE_035090 [Ameca splendens]|uniref:Uncharacterized protein n=1 Tax=Ameca splendens TaxID=208324 RepID=A0ABV1A3S9_9TELE